MKWDKVESKIRSIIRDKQAKLFISQGSDYFEDRSCLGKRTKLSSWSGWWIRGYVYIGENLEVVHSSMYFPICLIDFKKMLLKGSSSSSKMTWRYKRAPTEVGTTRNPEPGGGVTGIQETGAEVLQKEISRIIKMASRDRRKYFFTPVAKRALTRDYNSTRILGLCPFS